MGNDENLYGRRGEGILQDRRDGLLKKRRVFGREMEATSFDGTALWELEGELHIYEL